MKVLKVGVKLQHPRRLQARYDDISQVTDVN